MIRLTFLFAALTAALTAFAQSSDIRYCGQTEATDDLFSRFHGQRHVSETAEDRATYAARKQDGEAYIVPVVFHIIHNNGDENISDEQIENAMFILNRDMRKQNADTLQIVEEFADLAADSHIEFRLAQLDPNGNCTNGIVRLASPLTYQGNFDMKLLSNWPRESYLNVWVCADANGAAGYSQLPENVDGPWGSIADGIVMRHDYTGAIGTSNNTRSRALTHEVGHWLNLYHTWGAGNSPGESGNCGIDDFVNDTPETLGWTSCSISGETCGSLDNVQNYMEYSYCSRMFTQGQADRMEDALISSTADRNNLWTEENLTATGVINEVPVLCQANFSVNRTLVCTGDSIQFTDLSFNDPTAWAWDFGDGTVISGDASVANPTHAFTTPGTYSVTLTVGNGVDEVSTTEEALVTVLPSAQMASPFQEGFEEDTWMDTWFVFNPTDDQYWNDTSTGTPASGERHLRLSNNLTSTPDTYDWIESVTFDASEASAVYISYKWAYANRIQETDDRLRVKVSGDCGVTWSTRQLHRGFTDLPTDNPTNTTFAPNSPNDWTGNTVVIDQEIFLTENMRVMFEFQSKGGNNIYLDDINISTENPVSVAELDAGVTEALLFPNPTSQNATLRVNTDAADVATLRILDATGREVWNTAGVVITPGRQDVEVPGAGFPAGMYHVVLEGDAVQVRLPLVKQ